MKKQLVRNRLFPASVKTVDGTKWGYINELGQFVILPKFEEANDFQENGLAIVRIRDFASVINSTGEFVIPPKYGSIQPFSEGLTIVYQEGQGFKITDETGKELTEKAYPFISSFQEGRAVFQDHEQGNEYLYGYLDSKGKIIIPSQYEYANDIPYERIKSLINVKGEFWKSFH